MKVSQSFWGWPDSAAPEALTLPCGDAAAADDVVFGVVSDAEDDVPAMNPAVTKAWNTESGETEDARSESENFTILLRSSRIARRS